ncbi:MAG: VWA domain-containing protein [Lachnospiraceae bacterium]|nr:VWA domain-containing protein [Lachnospiraceae bacterium]
MKRALVLLMAAALMLGGCGKVRDEGYKSSLSEEDAQKELKSLITKVDVKEKSNPILDIYSDETSEADNLADIDTFPIMVKGTGSINIEIAAATELSADTPDDWLNEVAKRFNSESHTINGKSVSVSVRKITSGEVVTYILNDKYQPDVFIPSNDAWGKMLDSSGYRTGMLTDRIAGNTAGILIKKEVYEKFKEKYGEVTVQNVLEAANNRDLIFAYTNPYTSSTGLNVLCAMLASFDPSDPLSDKATQALLEYQKSSPPVAYTTAVLRNQAAKGVINAMVMEEQAYINTPELKSYVYTPVGIRHDHPVYTFEWTSDEAKEAAEEFVEFCKSAKMQELASDRGFNRHDEYVSQDTGMSGLDYLAAQKVWKQNKNGGKPIVAVFVADISGSMDGEPLNSLKQSLIASSSYISSEHYIGLVSYSSDVTVNLPIAQFDPTQRAYFSGEVKALNANGSTATYDALLVGAKMLKDFEATVPDAKLMLFLLTDGQQNKGYSYSRIEDVIGGLKIPVYTIAYNYSDTTELAALSNLNEAAQIKADSDDVSNVLRNLFNVNL